MGGDLLTSSSCFLIWNVPHVLFHTKKLLFLLLLVKNHTPMCVQTQMSGLMVTSSPPLHHWCVTIIIARHQQFQSTLGRMCHSFLMWLFQNSHMTIKDYKALPSSVKCIVAVMHTNQHYAVMEITIDTQTIKIFDWLYQPLLDWKDHTIRAMRNCMLVDPCVVPSSAQFNTDPAVYQIVSQSRKPQEYVNRYDIIIAMQK